MGCAGSKQQEEPTSPGSKKRVKRDSVVVTKARMEKNKGKPKEKAPANMTVEVVEQ